jgi:hypothetical protein
MTQSPVPSPRSHRVPLPVLVAAQWLLPGLGFALRGQPGRGAVIGTAILALFAGGLLIGGLKVVDPFATWNWAGIRAKPWYIGQVLVGPVAVVCGRVARDPAYLTSHARVNEIGLLYTAVAGMLNLFAMLDLLRGEAPDERSAPPAGATGVTPAAGTASSPATPGDVTPDAPSSAATREE